MNKLRLILGIILGKTVIYKAHIKYCGHIDISDDALVYGCSFITTSPEESARSGMSKDVPTNEELMANVNKLSMEWVNGQD